VRNRLAVADRLGAIVGGVLIFLYALLSGIGGPPSEFRQEPPFFAKLLADHLLAIYGGGAILGLVGLIQSAIGSRLGRWGSTCGGRLSSLGNLAAAGIAAPHEASVSLWLAAIVIPLVLVIWVPYSVHRIYEQRVWPAEQNASGAVEQGDEADER
jgi:hypothetical protein